jgi:glycosyltransferase involved in cell wall biosynthesis
MKVWVLPAGENWICDQIAHDWYEGNAEISVYDPREADVCWLLADWRWREARSVIRGKRIVTTVHHIVPQKFGPKELSDFRERDCITHVYHVPNKRTRDFINSLTSKPIHVIPYWANGSLWKKSPLSKHDLREKYGIPVDGFVIGSFQRDTEGFDLTSPKLEKGPDLLADFLIERSKPWQLDASGNSIPSFNKKMHVILAGWRRQYIISRLESEGVSYSYFELPSQEKLCELYQTLDLYPVTSRYEGGPQAFIECGLLDIPVVSRPVGMAEQVLPIESIKGDVLIAVPKVPDVSKLLLPHGFEVYRKLFREIVT